MTARGLLLTAAIVIAVTAVAFAVLLPSDCFFQGGPIPVSLLGADCEGLRADNKMAVRVGAVGIGLTLGLVLGAIAVRQAPTSRSGSRNEDT